MREGVAQNFNVGWLGKADCCWVGGGGGGGEDS